ncbi:MAG: sigma-54-dependent Fis family transcriptional regulator [Kofleriaceae bacterium]|nr:sigma-54-dependent Fis family transcriptional regulator [Kofleriaceae bacterium]
MTEFVGGRAEVLVMSRSPREIEEQLQQICHDTGCTPTIVVKVHGRDGLVASELISGIRENLFASTRTSDHVELASPIMHNLYALAEKIANASINIVIVGEEGTGKTSLARFIHEHSQQAQNFSEIDCAQPCSETLQRRLWDKKSGILEQGAGSTILLRNIDCLTPDLQEQLMTFLNSAPRLPRIISTVRRPIEDSVQSALFRTDLYYRLCGVSLDIPPLRQRNDDLLSLSRHFLRITGSANIAIPGDVEQLLSSYSWPGNIRELQNSIELAALLAEGSALRLEHFPATKMRTTLAVAEVVLPIVIKAAKPGMRAPGMRKEQIILALEQCGGNQTRAAKQLQVSRRTLSKWIGRFGLPRPRK